MSGKNDHVTLPPAENQVEIIRAIKRAAAKVYGLSPRVVDSKRRPVGTKTVVFDRKFTPRELDIIRFLGCFDELKICG
jgi:DNA-binding NarL/FixJ family response regulator